MRKRDDPLTALKQNKEIMALLSKQAQMSNIGKSKWILRDEKWYLDDKTGDEIIDLLLSEGISESLKAKFTDLFLERNSIIDKWKQINYRLDQPYTRNTDEKAENVLTKEDLTLILANGFHYSNILTLWKRETINHKDVRTMTLDNRIKEDRTLLKKVNSQINYILSGHIELASKKGWLNNQRSAIEVLLEISEDFWTFKKYSGNSVQETELKDSLSLNDALNKTYVRLGDKKLGFLD